MSSEESSRKTAANKPANREQETTTPAQRKPKKHSDGGHWPIPFDDAGNPGELTQSGDPQGGKIEVDV